jgi:hypothetical protein
MFKKLLIFLSILSTGLSLDCYTKSDVQNSDHLFWYKNYVYDIDSYNHPGGKSDLLKTIGQDLEIYFNMYKYDFHEGKKSVIKDLEDMLVGELKDQCSSPTGTDGTTDPESTTSIEDNTITSTTMFRTETIPTQTESITSNTEKLEYNSLLFYCLLFSLCI